MGYIIVFARIIILGFWLEEELHGRFTKYLVILSITMFMIIHFCFNINAAIALLITTGISLYIGYILWIKIVKEKKIAEKEEIAEKDNEQKRIKHERELEDILSDLADKCNEKDKQIDKLKNELKIIKSKSRRKKNKTM